MLSQTLLLLLEKLDEKKKSPTPAERHVTAYSAAQYPGRDGVEDEQTLHKQPAVGGRVEKVHEQTDGAAEVLKTKERFVRRFTNFQIFLHLIHFRLKSGEEQHFFLLYLQRYYRRDLSCNH